MKPYTIAELKYIEEFHNISRVELAEDLGRTPRAIQDQIYIMRKEGKLKPSGRSKPRPFTESELSYICKFYESDGPTALAAALERNRNLIGNKYRQLCREGKVDHYKQLWEAIG